MRRLSDEYSPLEETMAGKENVFGNKAPCLECNYLPTTGHIAEITFFQGVRFMSKPPSNTMYQHTQTLAFPTTIL